MQTAATRAVRSEDMGEDEVVIYVDAFPITGKHIAVRTTHGEVMDIQSMPKITGHTIIALQDRGVQNIQLNTVLKIIICVQVCKKYQETIFCFIIKI